MAPSAALEAAIEEFLAEGLGDGERLAEIGRLGARLVLQRAVEEEVTAFLGRARYERTLAATGSRNGTRRNRHSGATPRACSSTGRTATVQAWRAASTAWPAWPWPAARSTE